MGEKTDEVIVQEQQAEKTIKTEQEGFSETERLREEIEQTRLEMSRTLDEIKEQLSPERLREEAKERMKEASIGRSRRIMKRANNRLRDTVREHPFTSLLMGASAVWLLKEGIQSARSEREIYVERREIESEEQPPPSRAEQAEMAFESAWERGGRLTNEMRQRMMGYREKARERAYQYAGRTRESAMMQREKMQDNFNRMVNERPLIVAGAALALGAIVGSLIPETLREHELMGEQREQITERLKGKAEESFEKAKTTAKETGERIKEEETREEL
jgi:ElaB/YqjD/DUF883 family membrane-anchored ribosome-binding protein